ncbi:MAG: hydrogenase large subunit [Clostridia bacterium]|jgi:hydrogenase large subunit|nr:hydrogenase large subunit [Clostridia bacterium]MDN5323310.1 hydrogenase large subunit [Clostridia bacterium]
MVKKRILPLTRVHEPMQVEVEVNDGQVTDAWVSGTLFRGFELMLENRDPRDTAIYAQRICGICSTAHAVAGALALEEAYNIQPTPNGSLIRNLIFGSDFIQNHLRQFYVLTLPDYARGPNTSPFRPLLKGDYKIPKNIEEKLYENYWKATEISAKAHQMLAIWGAKAPHQQTILPGGVTEKPTAEKINMFTALLREAEKFVVEKYIPDVYTIAEYYPEYYNIGKGYGNLMSYGLFPSGPGNDKHFKPGIVEKFSRKPSQLDPRKITEEVEHSWYKQDEAQHHPYEEETVPDMDKPQAYSWVKTPLYNNKPFEGGPIARMWINEKYQKGVSVNDRNIARALELKEIINFMYLWLEKLNLGQPTLNKHEPKPTAEGAGLTDSMRGQLGHWVKIKNGRTAHYQIITPSAWNYSPKDKNNRRGPVEEALIGTPVESLDSLIEVGRVIRCFDPCFSCSVHVIKGNRKLDKYLI